MKNKHLASVLALALLFVSCLPSFALRPSKLENDLAVTGNVSITGTTAHTGAVTNSAAVTNSSTLTQTGAATFGSTVGITGNTTVGGTLGVTGAVTLTVPLTAANIQTGSAKRQLLKALVSPVTGAAADSTTYAGLIAFGRAGSVKRISIFCAVAPTVGTDTVEVLKNNTTTLLSAATFDANTLVAYTTTNASLTATTANLDLAATDTIRVKYNAGTQTVDAQNVEVVIEFEPTDY